MRNYSRRMANCNIELKRRTRALDILEKGLLFEKLASKDFISRYIKHLTKDNFVDSYYTASLYTISDIISTNASYSEVFFSSTPSSFVSQKLPDIVNFAIEEIRSRESTSVSINELVSELRSFCDTLSSLDSNDDVLFVQKLIQDYIELGLSNSFDKDFSVKIERFDDV